ncbi:MAG: MBOAT family protein [Lachnospiraceae bacterium]|nr:MBOAT family protein [Candidatus Colinaster equi]
MYIKVSGGDTIVDIDVLDYLFYILYFPKIISGPIVEPKALIEQIHDEGRKHIEWDNVASGARIFCYGLFKKMLLADTFSKVVTYGLGNIETLTAMDIFIVMLSYTFEIYFDFSGYSDMGVGISQMINIELPINFDSPYKALSIRDFWKRWHISLTSFLTKYIYIPLGGSRKGKVRTYINTMIVFVVSGIWHGANYTFILWGILHGVFSIADRLTEKIQSKIFDAVRWVVTFGIVNVLWLLFASESISQWKWMIMKMIEMKSTEISESILNLFVLPESNWIQDVLHLNDVAYVIRGFWFLLFMFAAFFICLIPENNYKMRKRVSYVGAVVSAVAFVWAFLCLGTESTFVYFGF